jgi:urea transport system permease protein
MTHRTLTRAVFVLVPAALLAFPWLAGPYHTSLLARYIVFGILALSFDLLWGYVGIMNFGQAAFFGIGAYTLGMTLKHFSFPGVAWVGLILAIMLPVLVSLVLGYFLFYGRVSGIYLAIVTLAFTTILYAVLLATFDFTGGLNGLRGYPIPRYGVPGVLDAEATGNVPYYMAVVAAVIVFWLARKLVRSSYGRVLGAIKNHEERVEFLGYNVPYIKMLVFAMSCGLAGLAGALYVPLGFVSPELMGLNFATNLIVWVAIGGRGTLIGAFAGTLIVSYLQLVLSSGVAQNVWFLLMGVFFIVVVMFWPDGLMGFIRRRMGQVTL